MKHARPEYMLSGNHKPARARPLRKTHKARSGPHSQGARYALVWHKGNVHVVDRFTGRTASRHNIRRLGGYKPAHKAALLAAGVLNGFS